MAKVTFEKEKINEYNKLIAEFMGYTYFGHNDPRLEYKVDEKVFYFEHGWKKYPNTSTSRKLSGDAYLCRSHTGLQYLNDWNHMMKVFDKINGLETAHFKISNKFAIIHTNFDKYFPDIVTSGETTLQATWLCAVEFIILYNHFQQLNK